MFDLKALQNVFSAPVADASPLAGEDFGLKLTLQTPTDMTGIFAEKAGEISALVDKLGVAVLTNATFTGPSTHSVSSARDKADRLVQDPFHIDYGFTPNDPKVSALFNAAQRRRDAPTYYAMAQDVRTAIGDVGSAWHSTLADDVCEALKEMQTPRYYFSMSPFERPPRQKVLWRFPAFTRAVFHTLPIDKRYAHNWTDENQGIVLHSNRPGHFLHGRPHSDTDKDSVLGVVMLNFTALKPDPF